MKQLLIVDDDPTIGDMLERVLTREDYGVRRAYSGTEALLLLDTYRPDLILLDLMLPGLSGEEVLTRMQKIQEIPVIVLSAKNAVDDKVKLLMDGACDYLTKPFEIRELLARISVQLRNASPSAASPYLTFREITMDTGTHEVMVNESPVHLTRTEYAILKALLKNPSQVVTRSALLDHVSLETPDCMESSLKVHISNLRKKLRAGTDVDYIEAVWGIGFKLKEE